MALQLNKKSNDFNKNSKLSKAGKIIILVGVILVILIGIYISKIYNNNKVLGEFESKFNITIDTGVTVMEQSLILVSADETVINEFNDYKQKLSKEKKVQSKYKLSIEMINLCLSYASQNQGAVDELNSIRNRIEFAYKSYNEKK